MSAYFSSSFAHLSAEIRRIDALIKRVVKQALETQAQDNPYPGLQITAQDAQALLNTPLERPVWATILTENAASLAHFAQDRQILNQAVANSVAVGQVFRLPLLMERFQLTPIEVDILLLCLIVEWDPRYAVFYAYLQNDVNKKRPTLDLIVSVLSHSVQEKWALRQYFAPTATLMRYALIAIHDQDGAPLLSRTAKVSERIIDFLLEQDRLPAALTSTVTVITPDTPLSRLILPDTVRTQLDPLMTTPRADLAQTVMYLQGSSGAGKRTLWLRRYKLI